MTTCEESETDFVFRLWKKKHENHTRTIEMCICKVNINSVKYKYFNILINMTQAEVSVTVFSCFFLWIVEEKKHKTHNVHIQSEDKLF